MPYRPAWELHSMTPATSDGPELGRQGLWKRSGPRPRREQRQRAALASLATQGMGKQADQSPGLCDSCLFSLPAQPATPPTSS